MDTKHQTEQDMDGDLGPSRGFAALHATGEEGEPAEGDSRTTNDVTGSNLVDRRSITDDRGAQGRITLRKSTRIGTWNVQTLHQMGKLCNITREMRRSKISILGDTLDRIWTLHHCRGRASRVLRRQ